jgi:putative lipoic acid-binding regulatory protein
MKRIYFFLLVLSVIICSGCTNPLVSDNEKLMTDTRAVINEMNKINENMIIFKRENNLKGIELVSEQQELLAYRYKLQITYYDVSKNNEPLKSEVLQYLDHLQGEGYYTNMAMQESNNSNYASASDWMKLANNSAQEAKKHLDKVNLMLMNY